MLGEWLSRFGGRCLFDFGASNLVGSVFSNKVVMLGVWLFRFGGRCLFDFGASNLIGSVFSNVSKVGAASFTCSTLAENFGKVICGADKAGKVSASSISEIGPRGLKGAQLLRKRAPLRFLRSAFVVFEQPNF
ncbi:hypothetical protein ACFX16_010560 [Malus domestica]